MINGNLPMFLDKLYWLEDLSVIFQEREYFIHGSGSILEDGQKSYHLEALELNGGMMDSVVFSCDAPTPLECVKQFREAPIWDGKCFDAVEQTIEWVD